MDFQATFLTMIFEFDSRHMGNQFLSEAISTEIIKAINSTNNGNWGPNGWVEDPLMKPLKLKNSPLHVACLGEPLAALSKLALGQPGGGKSQ